MGKKKATTSRQIRPIIERAMSTGQVFCSRARPGIFKGGMYDIQALGNISWFDKNTFIITFGEDLLTLEPSSALKVPSLHVSVNKDGEIICTFMFKRTTMTDYDLMWVKKNVEEIITMYKLGGYTSIRDDYSYGYF